MPGNLFVQQLLLKQSDTLPTQYKYIERLHEEIWAIIVFGDMTAL